MTLATFPFGAVQEAVRRGPRILAVGGGSKPALSTPYARDIVALDLSPLRGIVEYDPAELTFTALAGTPVADVSDVLAEHGQYLPFDPPLAASGATLGGAVAAGASGPGALRYGGLRDFVIGVRFVDGTGRLVTGGGKVVKNAAGFDLPKLMVGSMGRFGVMVQLSFKVFPHPWATTSLVFELGSLQRALEVIARLAGGPLELDALDLEPPGRLLVRIGGVAETLTTRATRIAAIVGAPAERLDEHDDAATWRGAADLAWAPHGSHLVRVALTARSVTALEAALAGSAARVRYSLAANAAWIAYPGDAELDGLDRALSALGLGGMVLIGPPGRALLGATRGAGFARRISAALDPDGRFARN